MLLDKAQAISKLNQFGQDREPCLFIIDFAGENSIVLKPKEATQNHIYYDFNGIGNALQKHSQNLELKILNDKFPQYLSAFNQVLAEIQNGNTFLLNLTTEIPIRIQTDLATIFQSAVAKYRLLYQNHWCCFSPETFIKIDNNKIATYPMKGTSFADTNQSLANLTQSSKEADEHATIVDLLRNDLSRVATKVRVAKYRYAEKISGGLTAHYQTSSEIIGELSPDWSAQLGDLLFTLIPAGSITGAPKVKTIQIIKHVEKYQRGFYTGVAGIFNGDSLDSTVLIRFIEKKENSYVFKAGGGITAQSVAIDEYQELMRKIYIPCGSS